MATTPESKVKDAVRRVIREFVEDADVDAVLDRPHSYIYSHWPVQNGMGTPTLDCVVCYYGRFIAIETKAPGKKPTPRQNTTIQQMKDAGAIVLVIDTIEKAFELRDVLNLIKWTHANDRKSQA